MYRVNGALRGECQGGKFTLAANQPWIMHRHFCLSGCWNIESVSEPLHLQFVWSVDKKYVSKECSCPGFQPVYAYRWLMVIMTQGRLSVQQRHREREAISQLSGDLQEKEKCSSGCGVQSGFITFISRTHTHTSVFGTLERSIERNSLGQMLKSVNVARTPESERERRE